MWCGSDVFLVVARLNIVYPMLFKLVNEKSNRVTHCGVLEFVADEGRIYLPYWASGLFVCLSLVRVYILTTAFCR